MKNIQYALVLVCLLWMFSSCTDEVAAPKYDVNGSYEVKDIEYWSQNQSLEFGAFTEDGVTLVDRVVLNKPSQAMANFTLNLTEGTYVFKLFISENSILKTDLYVFGKSALTKNLELPKAEIQLLSYKRVQSQLFNRCTQCHGNSEEHAAGLLLTAENSFANLVNMASKNSNLLRVEPYSTTNSFLVQVLKKQDLNFDHAASTMATSSDIQLIEQWINNGALND